MAPKPITFNESALPTVKADSTPNARQSEPIKAATTTDQQALNARARKPISERIATPNSTAPVGSTTVPAAVHTAGIKSRIMQKPKPPPAAVSPSARADTPMSHQPRENQPWINKMKRPSSGGPHPRDAIVHTEDRKRRRPEHQDVASVPSPAPRSVPVQKARPPQQQPVPSRGDSRNGVSQPLGPAQGMRPTPSRAGSTLHVLESGIKVSRSQPRPTVVTNKAGQAASHQGLKTRPEQPSEAPAPVLMGSTSWHAVIEQAREKAVQETDRALADVSDHLKTLLAEKVQQLADLCGFVVQVSQSHAGDMVATFKHASTVNVEQHRGPLEVPDSPSASGEAVASPRPNIDSAAATEVPPAQSPSPSPRVAPTTQRFEQDHPRQDRRAAVPLSARIELGTEAPMSFHRHRERETPPLPVSGKEASPDDIEEIHNEQSGPELVAMGLRTQGHQGNAHRDRARLPSPPGPRGSRGQVPVHTPMHRRRDDLAVPSGGRVMPDMYPGVMGPPRGPAGGRGWVRDTGRRGGRGYDHRGGFHHDATRRSQRR
eukprot:jgi/Ulvmu1/12171/UM085_0035.1